MPALLPARAIPSPTLLPARLSLHQVLHQVTSVDSLFQLQRAACHAKAAETKGHQRDARGTPGRTSDPLAMDIVPRLPRKSGGDPRKSGGDQATPEGRQRDARAQAWGRSVRCVSTSMFETESTQRMPRNPQARMEKHNCSTPYSSDASSSSEICSIIIVSPHALHCLFGNKCRTRSCQTLVPLRRKYKIQTET